MKIALAGNPNSGKTTLFNAITGKTEYVGNWAGVTVEKKEAPLKKKYAVDHQTIKIIDLPGAYSISPFTSEEAITRDFITETSPDVIINIVDGANLERSLFFTTQLLELGIPVVIALNKGDVIQKRGERVSIEKLSNELGIPVVETVAVNDGGLNKLVEVAVKAAGKPKKQYSLTDTSFSDQERQKIVKEIARNTFEQKRDASKVGVSDRIDRIVAHKFWGLPIFFLVMWAVYALSIEGPGGYVSGYFNDTLFGEIIPTVMSNFLDSINVSPILKDLIVEGAIGGVGAVVGFLPLIMVLFFLLALMEDSGYMSRVAVIMDRYFKRIGLSGKSIIPMIVGSGCSIPGVMATRTIEDINEKRMTTILTPFVPCGAKLPIIALFSAVFFPGSSWVGPSVYILAIGVIIISGLLLKRIFMWDAQSSFILELPEYKIPSLKHAFTQMMDKAKGFIYKATTIILVMNTLVWFMQAYSWNLTPAEDQTMSILASVGSAIAPLLIPMGFVGWQLAAAALTGFVAKENVVSTFAILLLAASEDALHMPGGVLTELFTPVTAYAYLAFNLFTPPCFAAIGAMNSEMGSKKWLLKGLGFQMAVGFVVATIIAQFGSLIAYGEMASGFTAGMIFLFAMAVIVIVLIRKGNQKRAILEASE